MKAMIRLNGRPPHAKYRLTISRLCMSRCGMWQIESIRHRYTPLEVHFENGAPFLKGVFELYKKMAFLYNDTYKNVSGF